MGKPTIGIITTGVHSTKDKMTRCIAVDLASGELVADRPIGDKNKTIGKFIAIVEAVKYILTHPEAPSIIYSDNLVAISWYHNMKTTSYQKYPEQGAAEVFLKVMWAKTRDIEVRYWNNREWGSISANFGNK